MKTNLLSALALAATMMVASTANAETVQTNGDLSPDPHIQTEQIKEVIEEVFEDKSTEIRTALTRIAMCESGGRNKDGKPTGTIIHMDRNGRITKNPGSTATGAFQVLRGLHSKALSKKGLDPRQVRDNVEAARMLVEEQEASGKHPLNPWKPSRSCWAA
jgi:hypothetical protein